MATRSLRFLLVVPLGLVMLATSMVNPKFGAVVSLAVMLVYVPLVLTLLLFHGLILPLAIGIRCPACRRRTLRKLARHPAFHQCSACGHRCKREGFAHDWVDASGPEDAAKFSPRRRAGRWLGYSFPFNPGKTTCGILLRNKRLRNPSKPAKEVAKTCVETNLMADPWLDG